MWIQPVDNPTLVRNGGYRIPARPNHFGWDYHAPWDEKKNEGTLIRAVDNGIVANEGFWKPGEKMDLITEKSGNWLTISHGNVMSSYSHLSVKFVKRGQQVTKGQPIGRSGYTGYVQPAGPLGTHLHFAKLVWDPKAKTWNFANPEGSFEPTAPFVEVTAASPKVATFQKSEEQVDTKYDSIFKKYLGEIPLALARALAYPLNPSLEASGSVGLFQITDPVRQVFNRAVGTAYTMQDLKDPDVNSRIGLWLLASIAHDFSSTHPNTMAMNWKDPRYVGLVLQGYHTGSTAVKSLVDRMETGGISKDKITIDTVQQLAASTGSAVFADTANAQRLAYIKSVLQRYTEQPDFPGKPVASTPAPATSKTAQPVIYMEPEYIYGEVPSDNTGGMLAALGGGFLLFAIALGGKKKKRT